MLYPKKIFKFVEEGVLVLPHGKYFESLGKVDGIKFQQQNVQSQADTRPQWCRKAKLVKTLWE